MTQTRMEEKMMGDKVTICGGCRPGEAPALLAGLQGLMPGVEVAVVDCMMVCGRPVTVSFRGSGKAAYLFAGVDVVAQGAQIAAFVRMYAEAPGGIIDDARPCGDLRLCLIGRIPA